MARCCAAQIGPGLASCPVISFIRGQVWHAGVDHLVVDTGPMGVRVMCPPATSLSTRVGEHIMLHTSVVIREDSWTVYGFESAEQVALFDMVQTVTGIGPRIALGVVSTLTPAELAAAIANADLPVLTKISGIGTKGASRMVLELKDKITPFAGAGSVQVSRTAQAWRTAVGAGLASLGWTQREADAAMDRVAETSPDLIGAKEPDIGAILKEALRALDRS